MARGYLSGQHKYKTLSQLQKVPWDSITTDCRITKYKGPR